MKTKSQTELASLTPAPATEPRTAPSLYEYLDAALKANVSHLAMGLNREPDGGIHFYIHPASVSGVTEDYLIWPDPFDDHGDLIGNRKNVPMSDVKGFLEKLRVEQLKEAHTPAPAPALAESAESAAEDICDIDGICIGACPGDSDLTAKSVKPDKVAAIILRHFGHLSVPKQAAVSQAPREAIEQVLPRDSANKHIMAWPTDYSGRVEEEKKS